MKRQLFLFTSLFLTLLMGSCGEKDDAYEAEILRPSQSDNYEQLTYTVRVVGSAHCDMLNVEVLVKIPIAADATDAAGLHMEQEHDLGRVKRDKKKSVTHTIPTFGRKVDLDAIEVEEIEIDDFDNCRLFRI